MAVVISADIGGTFTDVVIHDQSGDLYRLKIPSTPPAFHEAVVNAVGTALQSNNLDPKAVLAMMHGTTVATNTILERRGARTALLTTKGFRDVLELGRYRRPTLFDISWEKPVPLVRRLLRFEVEERVNSRGVVERQINEDEIVEIATTLREQNVESVAVCLINSYMNPENEIALQDVLQNEVPEIPVSLSSYVLPEIMEYERTSTTVVNAYIYPTVNQYVGDLRRGFEGLGVGCNLEIMQSNGSLLGGELATRKPVNIVESGPAAGVTGAAVLARELNIPNVIAFDMGGTTAKASLIEDGAPFEASEYDVGGGMNTNRLVMKGNGYTVRVPSIDIAEVGAGGGSIFWLDPAGAPQVGPASAGAVPGPICYGAGGTDVTVTDANLVLGYLNPHLIAGGAQRLKAEAAMKAVEEQVAKPLSLDLLQAAHGIHLIANSNMNRALRAVSTERGRDPRDFVLLAFGGAGPMHAAEMARDFGISEVVVPPSPGLFSALGLLVADSRHDFVASYPHGTDIDAARIGFLFAELDAAAAEEVGANSKGIVMERFGDFRYMGQAFELTIPLGSGDFTDAELKQARSLFDDEHEKTYGHNDPGQEVEIVNLRLRAKRPREYDFDFALVGQKDTAMAKRSETREAYFGPDFGSLTTPVIGRQAVSTDLMKGPLIVEEMDSTTVVPPYASVRLDGLGNLRLVLH